MQGILSKSPTAVLTKAFTTPLDNAIATARTCYSSRIIYDHEVSASPKAKDLRDKIAASTYMAGHHTTLQHAHFQFALQNISRHALWSFFHAHPFYNSEQVSQRYVEVKNDSFIIPKFATSNMTEKYVEIINLQNNSYKKLISLLHKVCEQRYFTIFRGRQKNQQDPRWQGAIKKRAQEIARYVLPIATHSHLYHTISGLTLHRYNRLANSLDCPLEQKLLIHSMVDEVKRFDPDFFSHIEDPLPLEQTLEAQALVKLSLSDIDSTNAQEFAKNFDQRLGGKTAKLVASSAKPEAILGDAVRNILMLSEDKLSDEQAIAMLLSPAQNRYLGESLNLQSLGKLSSALDMVHFSFIKKLSHSADCQAQRHRMIPGIKPIFSRTINLNEPDFITPELFLDDSAQEAHILYKQVHIQSLAAQKYLYEQGASAQSLQYLLTNAHPIRYSDTASLMDHLHKWTSRLCYNAQDEIWRATVDEVLDVQKQAPSIGRYLLPPCGLRKLSEHSPLCPEGDRFCGVPVWKSEVKDFRRLL